MNSLRMQGIVAIVVILLTAVSIKYLVTHEEKSPYIRRIEEQEEAKDIVFYAASKRRLSVAVPSALLITLLIGVSCWGRAHIKRASVHIYKIDESEIVVHEKDLHIAHQVAMGLINAKQLKEYNAGSERALQLSMQIADIQTRNFHALSNGKPLDVLSLPEQTTRLHHVPTFAELLTRGDLAPGKPLIIGYTSTGEARRSQLDDNYSTVVIGQSGTGKTTGEAYAIASTILAYGAFYTILDPHYPDKQQESLGDRLGALGDLPNVRIYNNPLLLDEIAETLNAEFDAHKADGNGWNPHIIVVDEHALWKNSTNGGKDLLKFEERMIYEGRKFGWYLHVTSKSPLAQDFGSSAVRDNFVTSLVYKVRKKQAQTYFADPELVELVQQCDKPGMAVYTDRQERSQVLHIPQIYQEDMLQVANMIGAVAVNTPVNDVVNVQTVHNIVHQRVNATELSDSELVNEVNARLKTGDLDRLSDIVGVSKPMLSMVLNGKRNVSEKIRSGLIAFLESEKKVIPFPEGGK